ncbi:MAG: glycosyltransferase family 4 protein [Ardenticatenaceae bacterium]|nr:glycosyltransferase family 4 protein [Ardenticatenaceae bacterium]
MINQTTNPAFNAWVCGLAEEIGGLALWSGNPPSDPGPGVTVWRGPAYDKGSTAARLRTWGAFTLAAGRRLLGLPGGRRTPIFVVSNPPFLPLLAWVLGKVQQRPYALLEWDIYPNILAPMGLAGPEHPLYRLWAAAHKRALRQAGLVVTIGEQMAATLRRLAEAPELPVAVIPNWVDTAWIRPLSRAENPFAREQGLADDQLVVMYSGNLGATHAIETIVAAAEALRDRADIQFVIIGEGSKRPLVEAALAEGRLPNTRLLPYQAADRLPYSLASADVGIVTLAAGYEELSVPSKTYNLLAAGNALLGISQAPNDLAQTIQAQGCGANFAPDDAAGMAAWLTQMAADRAALRQYQAAARQAAEQCYSRARCEALLSGVVLDWLDDT